MGIADHAASIAVGLLTKATKATRRSRGGGALEGLLPHARVRLAADPAPLAAATAEGGGGTARGGRRRKEAEGPHMLGSGTAGRCRCEAARQGGATSRRRRWRGGCAAAAGLFFFIQIFFKKILAEFFYLDVHFSFLPFDKFLSVKIFLVKCFLSHQFVF